MISSLKIKLSLWQHALPTVFNFVASFICYAVGLHLSGPSSASPLARAGALATAIAILSTFYDYRHALERGENQAIATFKKYTQGYCYTGKLSQEKFEKKVKNNTNKAINTIRSIDVILLTFATLVWGFGDLAAGLM